MEYIVDYKVRNKLTPARLEDIILRGEIGIRFDRFIHQRISGTFAMNEIMRDAEECFIEKYDDENPWGLWRGEFWGKMMISAVRVCRMKNHPGLREFLRGSAKRIMACQREDGYLSTYKDSDNIFPADKEVVKAIHGEALNFNWNVWSQKYTLWGLLECAMLCDDKDILIAAEKMATHLLDTVEKSGRKMRYCGVVSGMAACSVMKPLLILYRLTGNERYLDFCKDMADDWKTDDTRPALLLRPLQDKAPAHWFDGEENGEKWSAKAYEMMSCYDGICELYRITGDESLLRAVEALYDVLVKYESNILGSVGYNEWFADAKEYPDASTEICDVIHWMRICYELFCLTGKAKYMDSFELAFTNAFLAGVCEDGTWAAFFVRSSGRHLMDSPHVGTKYHHCCVDNVPRGFCNAAESVVMRDGNDFYINTYIYTVATFGDTRIKVSSGYHDGGRVAITVRNFPENGRIFVRVPEWSKKTSAIMNGKELELKCGEYNEVKLDSSDAIFRIRFDMTPRIYDFAGEYKVLPDDDYHIRRWTDDENGPCDRNAMVKHPMSTLRRGAVIYARSKHFGSSEEEMFSGKTVWGQNYTCVAEPQLHYGLLAGCRFTFEKDGESFSYQMCDYASAANKKLDDARYFTVFI